MQKRLCQMLFNCTLFLSFAIIIAITSHIIFKILEVFKKRQNIDGDTNQVEDNDDVDVEVNTYNENGDNAGDYDDDDCDGDQVMRKIICICV